ncbi:MBL fold metallo-hydrolase [Paenibacillus silviterrae]|uniref:MBL fold metallo-hydrolase n=1 Tax=Paenibacillus silviterrae TaxID=3242194 RepID=UPI00254273E0|nr:MBL fold metallo-hydrolase [Paenibacillus chinjuensis]
MSLQIQMIGTGSAFSKSYYNNNALVSSNGYNLLIDCGFTAPRALFELNIPIPQIDAVFISHIHADHIGGLEEMAFQLKYRYQHKLKLLVPEALLAPLWEHSLRGGLENLAEGITCLEDYFDVVPLHEGKHELHPGLVMEIFQTEHIPRKASYSVIFNDSVFYSADAKFDYELLVRLSDQRGIRYILHDCVLGGSGAVHATLDELLTLPEHIQRKVLLMHYSDNMPEYKGRTGNMSFIEQFKLYTF